MIDAIIEVLSAIGVSRGEATILVVLVAFLLYARKALGAGALLADVISKLSFAVGVLLILLVTSIVPTIDVSRAFELARMALIWFRDLLGSFF